MSQDEKFDMRNFFDSTNKKPDLPDVKETRGFSVHYLREIKKNGKGKAWIFIICILIIGGILFFFLREQNILFIKHNTKFYIDPKELEDYKHVQPF